MGVESGCIHVVESAIAALNGLDIIISNAVFSDPFLFLSSD
jgi:hypothetical protein